jgi:hypothetical protein
MESRRLIAVIMMLMSAQAFACVRSLSPTDISEIRAGTQRDKRDYYYKGQDAICIDSCEPNQEMLVSGSCEVSGSVLLFNNVNYAALKAQKDAAAQAAKTAEDQRQADMTTARSEWHNAKTQADKVVAILDYLKAKENLQ